MQSWVLFVRYVLSRRAESIIRTLGWLVMSATFLGVMSLVIVMCIMNGFNIDFREQLLATAPHLEIQGNISELQKKIENSNPEIQSLTPFSQQDVVIRTTEGKFSGAIARGTSNEEINEMFARVQKSQNLNRLHDYLELGPGEVVITESLGRSVRVYPGEDLIVMPPETLLLPPGEAPVFEKVRVRAFINVDVGEYSSAGIFFDEKLTFQRLKGARSRIEGVDLRIKNPNRADQVKQKLIETLHLDAKTISTWFERNKTIFFALVMEKVAMASMLSLAVLVTSFGIILLIAMLVVEKRKDIGLFQALGYSLKQTQNLFAGVGWWIASVGLFGGLIFGLFFSYLLQVMPLPEFPEIYTIRQLPVAFDLWQIFFMIIGLVVLALFASWLPVRRSLRLTPAQALRGLSHNSDE